MNCHDLDSDDDISETTSDPFVSISQAILAQLTHLDLGSRLVKKRRIVSGGAYGDIFRGRCSIGEGMVNVAIKCLPFYLKKNIRTLFEKEIYVWSKLRHKNILSLLGYAFDAETGFPLRYRNGWIMAQLGTARIYTQKPAFLVWYSESQMVSRIFIGMELYIQTSRLIICLYLLLVTL
ncbi:hypothetical protein ACEPAG_3288 [Sanghuangporus baumii]